MTRRDVRPVREADGDDMLRIEAVPHGGIRDKIRQFVGAPRKIVQIKDAFREAAEEAGHTAFHYLAAWAEQGGPAVECLAEAEQVVFIASCAVQQEQRWRSGWISGRNKLVDKLRALNRGGHLLVSFVNHIAHV